MLVTRIFKIKNVLFYTVIGTVVGTIIGILLHYIDKINIVGPTIRGLSIGFFVGTTIGISEEFLFLGRFRRKTYLFLLLFRTFVYSFVFAFYELLVNTGSNLVTYDINIGEAINQTVIGEHYLRDLFIIIIVSFLLIAFIQIRRLHKPGDLIKYIVGKYHLPEEVNKIFLFIDLKSSTEIAEKLGNLQYSSFMIDYFNDMTDAILMSRAEIYQYVGDEIILTWSFSDGIKDSRCVNCFYDIRNKMELNKYKYLKKFEVYPQFKAAIHAGRVSVTWIGSIKKEIVYHGDVLNTTARIQAECNKHNQYCLVSGYMIASLQLPGHLKSEYVGELQLKGKQEKVKIFGLKGIGEK